MTTRRHFIKIGSYLLSGIIFPYKWLFAESKKLAFPIAKVKKLTEINGWVILKIKGKKIMFVRDTEDSVKAFNPECTHKKCTVAYNPEDERIECPCHGSKFHLSGKVYSPPAKEPLGRYPAELSDGRVILTLEEIEEIDD